MKHLKPIHPFPARMAPDIVWEELPQGAGSLNVLDPMAGSGTTLVSARLLGHRASGFDLDPLAVLIADAWSSDFDQPAFSHAVEHVTTTAKARWEDISEEEALPKDIDAETSEFIQYWYDPTARRQLTALTGCINEIGETAVKRMLWCTLSRTIITKSRGVSRAMDVSHSRPHRVYDVAPVAPLVEFGRAAKRIASCAPFKQGNKLPPATMARGDARALPIPTGSIDFVITSPPYLNAIDYLRGHRLALVWMGHRVPEIRTIRSDSVGTERSMRTPEPPFLTGAIQAMGDVEALAPTMQGMIRRFVVDMDYVVCEISRVLTPGGRAVLVVGDSTLKGVFVSNSNAIQYIGARHGLTLTSRRQRQLPPNKRYLPPPSVSRAGVQLQARMREEVILSFVAR